MPANQEERVKITGGCACGDVRFGFYGPSLFQGACHCRSCQYSSGGGPAYVVGVDKEQFRVTKGRVVDYVTLSESGSLVTRAFCGRCGTHLYVFSDGQADHYAVKVGSLDDPSGFKPRRRYWTSEAQPWHKKFIYALRFRKHLPFPKLRPSRTQTEAG
ncbi:MAG: GFA family protein [Pseudomonadales bacterium]